MSKHKRMRRALTFLLLCLILVTSLPSCGSKAPELEEVYDRLVELIDQSVEVNVLLFGAGVPVRPTTRRNVRRILRIALKR